MLSAGIYGLCFHTPPKQYALYMIPEQQESTWLYEAMAWLELNRKRVTTAGIVVLAVIVAGYIYFWMRGQAALRANQALLSLEARAAGEGKPAAAAADFLKVTGDHASTRAADRASFLAAGQLFREGKYAEAQSQFEQAAARDGSGLLAPMAALGIAASLDAQNKIDAALTAYQEVVTRYPDEPAAGRARLALAGLRESRGEWEQALKIYDDLAASRTAGQASMEASVKRESLLKLHPELVKTNATPSLAPVPAVGATNAPTPAAT